MMRRKPCAIGEGLWSAAILAMVALTSTSPAVASSASPEPGAGTVRTEGGQLKGERSEQVVTFRGIPYAAPPIGELRWASPRAPAAWTGVRDATKRITPCAQAKVEYPAAITNEDCLYVNVTIPRDAAKASSLPVMVWLHGGGLSTGSADQYDPTRLAARGRVIVVTVESRINVLGYFAHPGLPGSGTFGLQDEQAALQWIRRNVYAFGGDPGNVTLFGESGGAVRTCAHLTAPGSKGLFQKAILQSGGCTLTAPESVFAHGGFWRTLPAIEADGRKAAAALGCTGTDTEQVACLRRAPVSTLLEKASGFGAAAFGTAVLPERPDLALKSGAFQPMPVLSGNTRNEGRALVAFLRMMGQPMTEERYAKTLADAFGSRADEVHAHYPVSAFAGETEAPALAWAAILTDRVFACPQLKDMRLLAAYGPVHGYQFADPHGIGLIPFPGGIPSGASHSSELPLLFDLTNGSPLDLVTGKTIPLTAAQRALGDTMIDYWTQFARTGDPNRVGLPKWLRYGTGGTGPQILSLAPSPQHITTVDSSAFHQCAFWESFLE
jgi:para-nitrobenzyl esterase